MDTGNTRVSVGPHDAPPALLSVWPPQPYWHNADPSPAWALPHMQQSAVAGGWPAAQPWQQYHTLPAGMVPGEQQLVAHPQGGYYVLAMVRNGSNYDRPAPWTGTERPAGSAPSYIRPDGIASQGDDNGCAAYGGEKDHSEPQDAEGLGREDGSESAAPAPDPPQQPDQLSTPLYYSRYRTPRRGPYQPRSPMQTQKQGQGQGRRIQQEAGHTGAPTSHAATVAGDLSNSNMAAQAAAASPPAPHATADSTDTSSQHDVSTCTCTPLC